MSEERKAEDEGCIVNLLHLINCDEVSVNSVVRLGKKPEEPNAKPRPVKLAIASEEQKKKILRSAKNLKSKKDGGWDKVYLQQDLTPKQRITRQQLVQELKTRQSHGEKDLMIANGKIVTRRIRTRKQEEEES